MPPPRLFLIDSFGFIFRAYHARARSTAPPMRTSSGQQTEAVYIFHNMMRRLANEFHPQYIAAVFESTGKTVRDEQFASYKANREEMPPDLSDQLPWVRKLLDAQRIPILQYDRYEADDVIGTIAKQAAARGIEVIIVSSDKDMLQLVNDHVCMLNPMKEDKLYDSAATEEFMGVAPHQVADLLALRGDTVDNIPGAPGIGDKGARDIVRRFGSVEAALDRAAEVEKKTYRESLQNYRDQILLSKQLATIHTDIPLDWNLDDLAVVPPDVAKLKQLYRQLEFFTFAKELAASEPRSEGDWGTAASADAVQALLAEARGRRSAVAVTQTGDLFEETHLGLAVSPSKARVIPESLFPAAFLADPGSRKVVHDAKSLIHLLHRQGRGFDGLDSDLMVQAFLLSPDSNAADLAKLSERYCDRTLEPGVDHQAAAILEITELLDASLEAKPSLAKLYRDVEMPLIQVLAHMERTGIRVETRQLAALSERMDSEMQRIGGEVYELAGKSFNINSPLQLGKVLFEDLALPTPSRYGKGKQISTAADVLEDLAEQYPIAGKVLEYRQLAKLKGTYVDALPGQLDPSTRRLHTTFHQTGAATGRLSSSNPNLQNIPIRSELGREIRAAFIPEQGWRLLVADYSQIELRLLAHLSQDTLLVDSFRKGEDIHRRTAAEVFGVRPENVTPDMRRNAKAVNFGIVYGQTPFGLATSLGISRQDAELYILNYFERYSGVHNWLEETKREVRQTGLSRTMFGRERPIPDMHSRNPNVRGFAERTAVNTPLQGAAADLIKIAMVRIHRALAAGWKTRLLLQVHDELVLESPPEEVERAAALVKSEMEGVAELSVPLLVETGIGDNWRDAK